MYFNSNSRINFARNFQGTSWIVCLEARVKDMVPIKLSPLSWHLVMPVLRYFFFFFFFIEIPQWENVESQIIQFFPPAVMRCRVREKWIQRCLTIYCCGYPCLIYFNSLKTLFVYFKRFIYNSYLNIVYIILNNTVNLFLEQFVIWNISNIRYLFFIKYILPSIFFH